MKLIAFAVVIMLAACSSAPKQDGEPTNEQLYSAGGQACPPGSVRPQLPRSYSGLTDSDCRTKFDWQRMKEIAREYDRCVSDAKNSSQEASCRYKMQ